MIRERRKLLIWGSGRIGRGFVGDLFYSSNYELVFVDQSRALVDLLNAQGAYTVVRAASAKDVTRVSILGYRALHISQIDDIEEVFSDIQLMAIATFPKDFEAVAESLQMMLLKRKAEQPEVFINIILCTNLVHAGPIFKAALYEGLDEAQQAYFDQFVGIVESLIIRMAPPAPSAEAAADPLVVWTNGYGQFPVDRKAFKGPIPKLSFLHFVEDMRAEEIRKMYTYNMCHAVLGYHGIHHQYERLVDCLADPDLRREAEGALDEVSRALQTAYHFDAQDMQDWIRGVLEQTNNPAIGDTVARMAADPLRKLRKEDRLVGPALLCLKQGVEPVHLVRAIGAALHMEGGGDPSATKMAALIKEVGLREAINRLCGLDEDPLEVDLADRIEKAYAHFSQILTWREKAQEAYELGFSYEKDYHGCGQCVFAAVAEVLGVFDPAVFNAATGLCGGIGLMNDSTCSAFTGGVLAIGLFFPRRREHFGGDKESKYTNFELVQRLREKFVQAFGSLTCRCVHEEKYGRAYDLSRKEERDAFEAAGGHGETGCTQTVGKAAQLTVEVLAPLLMEKMEV
jgi:mannitol-1-phosphate 5-dehydrogenase